MGFRNAQCLEGPKKERLVPAEHWVPGGPSTPPLLPPSPAGAQLLRRFCHCVLGLFSRGSVWSMALKYLCHNPENYEFNKPFNIAIFIPQNKKKWIISENMRYLDIKMGLTSTGERGRERHGLKNYLLGTMLTTWVTGSVSEISASCNIPVQCTCTCK